MTDDQLRQIADQFYTPDFAGRVAHSKLVCFKAEQEGRDIFAEEVAAVLGIPVPLFLVLIAWNVAYANSRDIIEAWRRDAEAATKEARH